jgi:hypothetical protein
MAFPIVPRKRSGIFGHPTSLFLGELAVNTHDGSVYLGADAGVVQIGMPVAAGTTVTESTGDGTTTAFTFSGYNGTADGGYIVSVGGIDQPPSVYSVSDTAGGTLTFNQAPPAGEIVTIRAMIAGTGGGGTANTGDITFSGTSIIGVTSNTELNNIELHPNPAYDTYGQFVVIRPTSPLEGNHIHIDKGGVNASLFLGSDDQYVNLAWDGSIELGVPETQTTQSYTIETTVNVGSTSMTLTRASNLWARDLTNGSTITRVSPSGTSITISTASVYGDYIYLTFRAPITEALTADDSVSFTYYPRKTWKFTNDGKMTFPDGSQQSTAGGGGGTNVGGQIWEIGTTYKQGDIVTTSQRDPAWICIENANTGHDPTGAPLWWQPMPADAVSLQLRPVATTAPTTGQALVWNAANNIWEPQNQQGITTTARTRYIGNGLQTAFFPIQGYIDNDKLKMIVAINGILQDSDETNNAFVLSSDNGGTITFLTAPPNNATIVVRLFGANGNLEVPKISASYAASFTGSNSVNLANSFGLGFGDFTVELFFNREGNSTVGHILCDQVGGIVLYTSGAFVTFGQTGLGTLASGSLPIDNNWHHIALVRESAIISLYVDGTQISSESDSTDLTTTGAAVIGALFNFSGNFVGKVGSVRISNTARYTGASITVPIDAFTSDGNTLQLLLQGAYVDNSLTQNGSVSMVEGPF